VTYSSAFYRVRGKVATCRPRWQHNQPIDARSDLFSLGVSTYETLIGERVYAGDLNTPADQIYAQPVPPWRRSAPVLPPEFQGVFDKALALDRDQRFQDAESFADAVREVAHRHGLLYSAPQLAPSCASCSAAPIPTTGFATTETRSARGRIVRPMVASDLEGQEASAVAVGSGADVETPTLVELARSRRAPQAAGAVIRQRTTAARLTRAGGSGRLP